MILSGCSQCQGFSGSSFIDCEVFVGSPLAGMGLRLFSADFWQESIFAYDCSQSFLYSLSDDIWLCLKNFSISDGMVWSCRWINFWTIRRPQRHPQTNPEVYSLFRVYASIISCQSPQKLFCNVLLLCSAFLRFKFHASTDEQGAAIWPVFIRQKRYLEQMNWASTKLEPKTLNLFRRFFRQRVTDLNCQLTDYNVKN